MCAVRKQYLPRLFFNQMIPRAVGHNHSEDHQVGPSVREANSLATATAGVGCLGAPAPLRKSSAGAQRPLLKLESPGAEWGRLCLTGSIMAHSKF